jgi:hypothetical protein
MVDAGYLSEKKAARLYHSFWPSYIDSMKTEYTTKTAFTKSEDRAPYFTDYVRQILTARFGKEMVYNEGLTVYTTLNLKRQEIAEKYFYSALAKQNEISDNANKYYNSAVDRSLFGAYNVLRMVFNLPACWCGMILRRSLKREWSTSFWIQWRSSRFSWTRARRTVPLNPSERRSPGSHPR